MKTTRTQNLLAAALFCALALVASTAVQAAPLPSWNDTVPKQAIVAFVEKVTKEGSPDFVPEPERIAVFDNDGTLWSEQPMYFQAFFIFDRIKQLAPKHPEWKTKEPFASVLKGDVKTALAGGEHALVEMAMATHAGMTAEEFEKIVTDWIATAKHPNTKRLYTEMVFQPMLELLAYLRANGFKTWIVSGGGVEFMRPWTEKVYGIPPEQVIGSSGKLKFEVRKGKPVLVKLPTIEFIDDKAGKPVGIQMHIGRRPIAAFGNSDGDLQMLQWTAAGSGARFCLYVHHTDAEREWAYDRKSSIGRLDKGLDEARTRGWTVVEMKNDWKEIYPPVSASAGRTEPTDVPLLARWTGDYPVAELGRLPESQRKSGVGFIGDADRFASVWKAFHEGEPVPSVDFEKNVVVFVRNTEFYNRISIGKATLADGVLSVLAMETMSAMPIEDKVGMALASIPREGVRFIQGAGKRIPVAAQESAVDPLNATYTVEGHEIRLINGRHEMPAAPDAVAKIRTRVFGEPVWGDLNGDGAKDAALLLVHAPGGSGTFYYVAVALNTDGAYRGTNGVLLGDRIAPRNVLIRNGVVIANYTDRRFEESMTTPPSVGKSKALVVDEGKLEVL